MNKPIERVINGVDEDTFHFLNKKYAETGRLNAYDTYILLTILKEAMEELNLVKNRIDNMDWVQYHTLEERVIYADGVPVDKYDDYNEYMNKVDSLESKVEELEDVVNSIRSAFT